MPRLLHVTGMMPVWRLIMPASTAHETLCILMTISSWRGGTCYNSPLQSLRQHPTHAPRKPGSAEMKDGLGQTQPSKRRLRPHNLPSVDLTLHPSSVFNSVSVYLCPPSPHSHLYDLAMEPACPARAAGLRLSSC